MFKWWKTRMIEQGLYKYYTTQLSKDDSTTDFIEWFYLKEQNSGMTDMVFGFFNWSGSDISVDKWGGKKRGCYLKLDLGKIFIVPQTRYPLCLQDFPGVREGTMNSKEALCFPRFPAAPYQGTGIPGCPSRCALRTWRTKPFWSSATSSLVGLRWGIVSIVGHPWWSFFFVFFWGDE